MDSISGGLICTFTPQTGLRKITAYQERNPDSMIQKLGLWIHHQTVLSSILFRKVQLPFLPIWD